MAFPGVLGTTHHSPRIDPYQICVPPQKNHLAEAYGTLPNFPHRHRIWGFGYPVGSSRGHMVILCRVTSVKRPPPPPTHIDGIFITFERGRGLNSRVKFLGGLWLDFLGGIRAIVRDLMGVRVAG